MVNFRRKAYSQMLDWKNNRWFSTASANWCSMTFLNTPSLCGEASGRSFAAGRGQLILKRPRRIVVFMKTVRSPIHERAT